jgi:hypothetical protein
VPAAMTTRRAARTVVAWQIKQSQRRDRRSSSNTPPQPDRRRAQTGVAVRVREAPDELKREGSQCASSAPRSSRRTNCSSASSKRQAKSGCAKRTPAPASHSSGSRSCSPKTASLPQPQTRRKGARVDEERKFIAALASGVVAVAVAVGAIGTAGATSNRSGNQLAGTWSVTLKQPALLPPMVSLKVQTRPGSMVNRATTPRRARCNMGAGSGSRAANTPRPAHFHVRSEDPGERRGGAC